MKDSKIVSGMMWKLLERFGVQGVQFGVQIILARLLLPEHYGALSLMVILTSLANVFIQTGFNTALIQNREITEDDYSSVFWVSLGVTFVLYGVIFVIAPHIALLYDMPVIVVPLRVLALMLFPGTFNSIQLAKVSRKLEFRKVFFSNIGGIVISGLCGIVIAYLGGGLWALVVQTMMNIFVSCIVMAFTVQWFPRFVCDLRRVKVLFTFGWKLLAAGLLDTLYQDVRSLAIGLKYDSGTLGYYNRGKQFPQFMINAINSAVQSVMLPAMSDKQDSKGQLKALMRKSIMLSTYIIFPMLAGLASVATPLVQLLLTDKWLPCVPYLQIYCFTFAFLPVHSCNLQAINAMGRSDIFLKLEIIKKAIGITALSVGVFCFDSPIAIAMTGVFTTIISCFVNAFPNKKLIGYSYFEQMQDIFPSFFAASIMCAVVLLVGTLQFNAILTIVLQVIVGVIVYVLISVMVKLEPFYLLQDMTKKMSSRRWQ